MAALTLSRDEIKDLTGCARRATQRQHLDAMGIHYRVNADGWPVVDRRAYERTMGVAANDSNHEEASIDMGFLDL